MDFSVEGAISVFDLRAALSVLPYLEMSGAARNYLRGYAVSDGWLTFEIYAPHMTPTGKPTGTASTMPVAFQLLQKSVLRWPSSPTEVWGEYLIIPTGQGSHPDQSIRTVDGRLDKKGLLDKEYVVFVAKALWEAWTKFLRHCTMEFVDGEWMIHHPVHGNIKVVKE